MSVNTLDVLVKLSRTSRTLLPWPSRKCRLWPLSLLSAAVFNRAPLARSTSTKTFPGPWTAGHRHHCHSLDEIPVWGTSCHFPAWRTVLTLYSRELPDVTAHGDETKEASVVSRTCRLWDPKLCLSSFMRKMGLLLVVPTSWGCCEGKVIRVDLSLAHSQASSHADLFL